MILPDSRNKQWIEKVSSANNIKDHALVEKTIRAFSLLEALVRSGCPFIFKGGTSLMLHLESSRRLSVDIDIICEPETDIESYLGKYCNEYGFEGFQLVERISRTNVPKQHAKFFYQLEFPSNTDRDKILLDVLFEEVHYTKIVEKPIESRFLHTNDQPVMVRIPSHEDLLGDKLTAFAPHTTGIPFYKGDKCCSMEIIKQLFDVSSLFDITDNMAITSKTFEKFSKIELDYRQQNEMTYEDVLDDIYTTAICICLKGLTNKDEYKLFLLGIKQVSGYIFSESYNLEHAIVNASKAAYLSVAIKKGVNILKHYSEDENQAIAGVELRNPIPTKLNKLKKTNAEAFFYWCLIQDILNTP